jgi:hypothetical protein
MLCQFFLSRLLWPTRGCHGRGTRYWFALLEKFQYQTQTSRHATYQPILKLTVKKETKLCLPFFWRMADGLIWDWADAKVLQSRSSLPWPNDEAKKNN